MFNFKQISAIEFNIVAFQELDVLLFERFGSVMFFLVPDIFRNRSRARVPSSPPPHSCLRDTAGTGTTACNRGSHPRSSPRATGRQCSKESCRVVSGCCRSRASSSIDGENPCCILIIFHRFASGGGPVRAAIQGIVPRSMGNRRIPGTTSSPAESAWPSGRVIHRESLSRHD